MRRECCRCGTSLGPDIPDPDGWDRALRGVPVSHGFCPSCLAEETRRFERERKAAETTDPGDDNPGSW